MKLIFFVSGEAAYYPPRFAAYTVQTEPVAPACAASFGDTFATTTIPRAFPSFDTSTDYDASVCQNTEIVDIDFYRDGVLFATCQDRELYDGSVALTGCTRVEQR